MNFGGFGDRFDHQIWAVSNVGGSSEEDGSQGDGNQVGRIFNRKLGNLARMKKMESGFV